MVSYQAWVSVVFETLQEQGVELSDIDDGAAVMEFCAQAWRDNGRRLKRMNESQAKGAAMRLARQY